MNTVLEALAGEHATSLARVSGLFEELLTEEARQRATLKLAFDLTGAWLQQLKGAFGSSHNPEQMTRTLDAKA